MTSRTASTRRHGRAYWLGLIASVSMVATLLVPLSAATADTTFGKPTSVGAVKISGSNGLKVTWKAPSGGTPAAYKVTWGKSSSATKATNAAYVTGRSATLSGTGMDTKTYYYVWVQPWSAASSTGKATGALSSSDKVKTSSYAYSAPASVKLANMTKTTAEVTWRTVTGSPGYVIRAYNYTTGKYKYQIGFDGSALVTGLAPGTKYKFTIANRLLTNGYDVLPGVRMSGFSSKYATGTTNPVTVKLPNGTTTPMGDAPTELKLGVRDSASVTLSWTPPSNYNKATDKFRAYWAENQEMTDGDGYTKTAIAGTSGKVTGLDSNTNYYLRIRMVRETVVNGAKVVTGISDRSTAIMAKTRSPKGWLSGKATGVSGGVLADYQAIAFARTSSNAPGEINAVADVSSSGTYKLELRPGSYFVQLAYVGTGNYTSNWLSAGAPAFASTDSTTAKVTLDKTTSIANIVVGAGGILKGTVTNTAGTRLGNVYVSARAAWSAAKNAVAQTTTDKSGNYTLQGLPPGKTVWVRGSGSQIGYESRTLTKAESVPGSGGTRTATTLRLAK